MLMFVLVIKLGHNCQAKEISDPVKVIVNSVETKSVSFLVNNEEC